MLLFHATAASKLASIQASGVSGPSYWTDDAQLAWYYAETIMDEGEEPVFLMIDDTILDEKLITPDYPSIEEPIMSHVRERNGWSRFAGEETLYEEWQKTDGSWQAALKLTGSICYRGTVPSSDLNVVSDPNMETQPALRS